MSQFLMSNYNELIIAAIVVMGVLIFCLKFMKLAPSEQKARVKIVLLELTTKAEAQLGSKTGQIKRSQVYSLFKEKFPVLSLFFTEKQFDELLDETLVQMRECLGDNKTEILDLVKSE